LALFAVIALFAVFAGAILFWLKGSFEAERADKIDTVKRTFSPAVLGLPDDLDTLNFAEMERLNGTLILHNAYIRAIVVSKIVAGRGERIVLPFFYSVVHPDWPKRLAQLDRHVLKQGDVEYGVIYFDFDNSRLHSVRGAIGSLAALLVLVLALVVRRLWVQEAALTRTTVELEEKKRELVELERLSLAGQLSANIFHDIRKPLLNIRMDVEEIEAAQALPQPARERLGGIRHHIELFFNILREINIERFIRGDQAGHEFVNVSELLERACALVRYERGGVEIQTEFATQPPPVLAFPYRLIQVFSNIILNAYQAMAGHGRLALTTSQDGDWVVVRIADTGPGIEPDHLERIFEPFYSTRQGAGGSGLGLYISKSIVEDLGGTIKVSSEVGHGSVFEIRLPISK
jgi:signal transduction histidine kinase